MAKHVIAGSGAIGTATATALLAQGHDVTIVTRSGTGPEDPRITRIALDASDADALTRAAEGATALYNCMNPPYRHKVWAQLWPPLSAALITAAERTGAGLVTTANLYNYGRVDAPMTPDTPEVPNGPKGEIRKRMWAGAKAANDAGRIRATEARASDFVGPRTENSSYITQVILPAVSAGRTVRWPFHTADVPHSWTYVGDVGRTLAALAQDDRSWGQVWHVPTNPARTAREVVTDLAAALNVPAPKIATTPRIALSAGALVVPFLRELRETRHEFERPFVIDATRTEQTFGLEPTPWQDVLASYRKQPDRG